MLICIAHLLKIRERITGYWVFGLTDYVERRAHVLLPRSHRLKHESIDQMYSDPTDSKPGWPTIRLKMDVQTIDRYYTM